MRMSWSWAVLALLFAIPANAEEPKVKLDSSGKIIRESWDAAFLQGQKAGYYRTTVREFTRDGEKLLSVTQELHMTVRRDTSMAVIHAESGNEETPDGKVVGVFMRLGLAKDQTVNTVGRIDGKIMRVKIQQPGKPDIEREIPWDDNVIGLIAEGNLLKDRQ